MCLFFFPRDCRQQCRCAFCHTWWAPPSSRVPSHLPPFLLSCWLCPQSPDFCSPSVRRNVGFLRPTLICCSVPQPHSRSKALQQHCARHPKYIAPQSNSIADLPPCLQVRNWAGLGPLLQGPCGHRWSVGHSSVISRLQRRVCFTLTQMAVLSAGFVALPFELRFQFLALWDSRT